MSMTNAVMIRTQESELLRRFALDRSEEAFAELVGRCLDLVYSAALRQVAGNSEAARDVSQMVFIELAQHAERLAHHPALTGWLYQVTGRIAARYVRSEIRRQRREQAAFAMQDSLVTPMESEPSFESSRLARVLDAALHELAEADRLAILLRHFERRPLAEIGTRLGLTENAARMRVERALDKLRARLAKHGVTSTASALATTLTAEAVQAAPFGLASGIAHAAGTAAAAGSTLVGLFFFTTMSPLKLGTALLLAGAITSAFLWQQHRLTQLRTENQELRHTAELNRPAVDPNADALAARAREQPDAAARQAELLRLRGEVARLRNSAQNPPASPSPAEPPSPPAASTLADLGNRTPEDAASTLFWALTQRDEARFSELIYDSAELPPELTARLHQSLFQNQTRNYRDKIFTTVREVRTRDDGSVSLDFGFQDPVTGAEDKTLIQLRQTPSGWKIDPGQPPPEMLQAAQTASPSP